MSMQSLYTWWILVLCGLIPGHSSQVSPYEIGTVEITQLSPKGLRITVPYERGAALFSVGYSINRPCSSPNDQCDWYFNHLQHSYRTWTHRNYDVLLYPGDTLNYWVLVVMHGRRYTREAQSWTFQAQAGTGGHFLRPSDPTLEGLEESAEINNPLLPRIELHDDTRAVAEEDCRVYPCLILREEFDELNFTRWKHDITANGGHFSSFQYFTNDRKNSYVRDGVLYIKPTLTSDDLGEEFLTTGKLDLRGSSPASACTSGYNDGCYREGSEAAILNPVRSARINSRESFNFKYGYIEVEAKLPKGDWIWPGISLLPKHEEYGGWPASGEITMVQSRGNRDLLDELDQHRGCMQVESGIYLGPRVQGDVSDTFVQSGINDYADIFHKYGMEWSASHIRLSVDGEILLNIEPDATGMWGLVGFENNLPIESNIWSSTTRMSPFDKEFYVSLGVSVGAVGGYFSHTWNNTAYPHPWGNTTSQREATNLFWQAKPLWYPTWNPVQDSGEQAALKVKHVRVWKLTP